MKLAKLVAAIALLAPVAAGADTARAQAKRDVAAGLAAQKAGHYDEAIALYRKAYDAVPHPEILFDLAQAYRLAGDVEAALEHYRRYLRDEPDGRVAKDAARWIAELDNQLAVSRAGDEAHEAKVANVPPPIPAPAPPPARPRSIVERPVERGSSSRGAIGAVTVAIGGGAVVGGLVAGELARLKRDSGLRVCGRACTSTDDAARANALLAQSRLRGDLATGLVAGGATLVIGGAIVWWTAPRAHTVVAPSLTATSLAIVAAGSF